MATFYFNGVSRALRSVQRVDMNYNIASAVRTGDSLAEVRGHRLWISEGELGRPLARVGVAPVGWPWRPLPAHPVVFTTRGLTTYLDARWRG